METILNKENPSREKFSYTKFTCILANKMLQSGTFVLTLMCLAPMVTGWLTYLCFPKEFPLEGNSFSFSHDVTLYVLYVIGIMINALIVALLYTIGWIAQIWEEALNETRNPDSQCE